MKIVLTELLSLLNLIKAQVFHIYKLTKIVIVNENKNLIFIII